MDATLARQRSGEKFVYVCFAILAEFVGASSGAHTTSPYTQELCDILTTSCLLPAVASYLLNDSGQCRHLLFLLHTCVVVHFTLQFCHCGEGGGG